MVQSQETSRRTAAAAGRMESNSMSSSSWHVFRLGWASRKREHLREPTDAARDGRQARRDATRGTIRAVRRGRSRRLGGSRADSALAPRYPGILDGGSGRQKSVAASARQCFSCPALAADDSLDRGRGVLRSPIVTNARAGRAFVEFGDDPAIEQRRALARSGHRTATLPRARRVSIRNACSAPRVERACRCPHRHAEPWEGSSGRRVKTGGNAPCALRLRSRCGRPRGAGPGAAVPRLGGRAG